MKRAMGPPLKKTKVNPKSNKADASIPAQVPDINQLQHPVSEPVNAVQFLNEILQLRKRDQHERKTDQVSFETFIGTVTYKPVRLTRWQTATLRYHSDHTCR